MNYSERVEFDDQDRKLLEVRVGKRKVRQEENGAPEVGDFVIVPCEDGGEEVLRFTHEWDDTIQTTVKKGHPCANDQSFYIDRDGECSFSGSLDRGLDKSKLVLQDGMRYGNVWFFHHDWPGAFRGVYSRVEFKIWRYVP